MDCDHVVMDSEEDSSGSYEATPRPSAYDLPDLPDINMDSDSDGGRAGNEISSLTGSGRAEIVIVDAAVNISESGTTCCLLNASLCATFVKKQVLTQPFLTVLSYLMPVV